MYSKRVRNIAQRYALNFKKRNERTKKRVTAKLLSYTYYINTGWSGKNPDYPNHKEITTWNNAIRYFVTLDVN